MVTAGALLAVFRVSAQAAGRTRSRCHDAAHRRLSGLVCAEHAGPRGHLCGGVYALGPSHSTSNSPRPVAGASSTRQPDSRGAAVLARRALQGDGDRHAGGAGRARRLVLLVRARKHRCCAARTPDGSPRCSLPLLPLAAWYAYHYHAPASSSAIRSTCATTPRRTWTAHRIALCLYHRAAAPVDAHEHVCAADAVRWPPAAAEAAAGGARSPAAPRAQCHCPAGPGQLGRFSRCWAERC